SARQVEFFHRAQWATSRLRRRLLPPALPANIRWSCESGGRRVVRPHLLTRLPWPGWPLAVAHTLAAQHSLRWPRHQLTPESGARRGAALPRLAAPRSLAEQC